MAQKIIFIAALFTILSLSYAATAQPLAANYTSIFSSWLPILLTAAMLAISLTVVYYLLGVLLNNTKVKGAALSEMQQVLGTILIVVLVMGVMLVIGSGISLSYQAALSQGPNAVTNQISNICNNVLINSQVGFLNSAANSVHYPHPYPNLPQPTSAVCQIVNGKSNLGASSPTENIDYGLAASYVIIANLTNQSVQELNYLYNYDSLLFFIRSVTAYAELCTPGECVIPFTLRSTQTTLSYSLYRGYVFQRTIMPVMDTQSNLAIYLNISQMIIILILLVTWPYLLAAGILFRLFSLTRRAGGLLIAIVIVGTIIYPTLFLFQYSSLNNLLPPGAPGSPTATSIIGPSAVPSLSLCGIDLSTPTLYAFTTEPTVTKFQLFCYTSSDQLKLSNVYENADPNGQVASAGTESNCISMGETSGTNLICACPSSSAPVAWFSGSGQWDTIANCYVKKNLSFYVFPDAASVIRLYTCYPPDYGSDQYPNANTGPDGILYLEAMLANGLNSQSALGVMLFMTKILSSAAGSIPAGVSPASGVQSISSAIPNDVPSPSNNYGLPCSVSPISTFDALDGLINLYGYMSVVNFMIPLLNILIMLSTTFGISALMGGETNIIGLSRFI